MNTNVVNFQVLQDRAKVERIRGLLYSPGWMEDFAPYFASLREESIQQLLNPSLARQYQLTDDYLRARVHILDELLKAGQGFLAEYDAARQQEEEHRRAQMEYQARADVGQMAPSYFASGY